MKIEIDDVELAASAVQHAVSTYQRIISAMLVGSKIPIVLENLYSVPMNQLDAELHWLNSFHKQLKLFERGKHED